MNYGCPHCGKSLRWKLLKMRHQALSKSELLCPFCAGTLIANKDPVNVALKFLVLLPAIPLAKFLKSDSVPFWGWAIVGVLVIFSCVGVWRMWASIPKDFQRYSKA